MIPKCDDSNNDVFSSPSLKSKYEEPLKQTIFKRDEQIRRERRTNCLGQK
jgi:hypothetical protein